MNSSPSNHSTHETENLRRSLRTNKGKNPRFIQEENPSDSLLESRTRSGSSKLVSTKEDSSRTASSSPARRLTRSKSVNKPTKQALSKKNGQQTTDLQSNKSLDEDGEEDEEEEEIEGVVECICGATEDDGELMAECEDCLKWQHIVCMTGRATTRKMPTNYYCSECRPHMYPNIDELKRAAIERFEKSNKKSDSKSQNTREKEHISESKFNQTTLKDTIVKSKEEKSQPSKNAPDISSGSVAARTRKRRSDANELTTTHEEQHSSNTYENTAAHPYGYRGINVNEQHTSTILVPGESPNAKARAGTRSKRKVSIEKSSPEGKVTKKQNTDTKARSSQLASSGRATVSLFATKVRENVFDALKTLFEETIIPKAIQLRYIAFQQDENATRVAERFAKAIENALFEEHAIKPDVSLASAQLIENRRPKGRPDSLTEKDDVGSKYRASFRSVFNLLKNGNFSLCHRLLTGSLSFRELVLMKHVSILNPVLQKFADTLRAESIRYIEFEQAQEPNACSTTDKASVKDVETKDGANNSIQANPDILVETQNQPQQNQISEEAFESIGETSRNGAFNSEYLKVWSGDICAMPGKFFCEGYHLDGPAGVDPMFLWSMCGLTSQISTTESITRTNLEKQLQPESNATDIASMVLSTTNSSPEHQNIFNNVFLEYESHGTFGVISNTSALSTTDPKGYLIILSEHEEIPSYLGLSLESRYFLTQIVQFQKRVMIIFYIIHKTVLDTTNTNQSNNIFNEVNEMEKKEGWYGGYVDRL